MDYVFAFKLARGYDGTKNIFFLWQDVEYGKV